MWNWSKNSREFGNHEWKWWGCGCTKVTSISWLEGLTQPKLCGINPHINENVEKLGTLRQWQQWIIVFRVKTLKHHRYWESCILDMENLTTVKVHRCVTWKCSITSQRSIHAHLTVGKLCLLYGEDPHGLPFIIAPHVKTPGNLLWSGHTHLVKAIKAALQCVYLSTLINASSLLFLSP